MKIHKVTLFLYEFEGDAIDNLKYTIGNDKYLNGHVLKSESIEVNDWSDEHPMNLTTTDTEKWFEENKDAK